MHQFVLFATQLKRLIMTKPLLNHQFTNASSSAYVHTLYIRIMFLHGNNTKKNVWT